jgi:hypothetical protein
VHTPLREWSTDSPLSRPYSTQMFWHGEHGWGELIYEDLRGTEYHSTYLTFPATMRNTVGGGPRRHSSHPLDLSGAWKRGSTPSSSPTGQRSLAERNPPPARTPPRPQWARNSGCIPCFTLAFLDVVNCHWLVEQRTDGGACASPHAGRESASHRFDDVLATPSPDAPSAASHATDRSTRRNHPTFQYLSGGLYEVLGSYQVHLHSASQMASPTSLLTAL